MDFLTGLHLSEGFNAILVIVDRLTKIRHLIACYGTTKALDLVRLYLGRAWRHHGLPNPIVSDPGPQFTHAS